MEMLLDPRTASDDRTVAVRCRCLCPPRPSAAIAGSLQPPNALNPAGLAPIAESQIQTTEFMSVDLRVTKAFVVANRQRLEVIAQVFNLLNRTNLLPVWTTNSLSNVFGTITSASNMRQAEFAIRYSF